MVKVTVYDWINEPELVGVYEGTEQEVEIHLRSRFMKDTAKIPAGDFNGVLLAVSAKFGVHIEAWKKVI